MAGGQWIPDTHHTDNPKLHPQVACILQRLAGAQKSFLGVWMSEVVVSPNQLGLTVLI